MLADLLSGKSKFHNVFHYPTVSWGDVGVIAWLVDAAAIISQKALLKCSYAPYARIMKKICWEESFHILHGRDVILAMMTGTDEQRELVQEALNRWWGPLMQFHGNPIAREEDPMYVWRIKSQGLRAADLGAWSDRARPELAPHGRGRLGVQRARLGRAEVRRHRARAALAGAARLPPSLPRPGEMGPRLLARCVMPIFEVFRQEKKGQAFAHAGSVEAPDAAFAEAWAREQYGRRGESEALWLVPRESVHAITDWADEFDLKYRRVDGYSIKARLKEARERAGTAAPVDR
jgi:phenylacetate-CoA oxygenase PaaH subunit